MTSPKIGSPTCTNDSEPLGIKCTPVPTMRSELVTSLLHDEVAICIEAA